MKNTGVYTLVNRNLLFAALILLVVILTSGSLSGGWAQGSEDRAIDQAQRAVREQIISREVGRGTREGGRDPVVRFNRDAQTEFKSNAEVRVRGTGTFSPNNDSRNNDSRNNDGQSRNFSYEAVVNDRNRNVSDIRYDWRGDGSGRGDGNYGRGDGGYGVQTIYCASDDMRRHTYNINTSGGVRLVQQKSDAACVQGRTWGYNRNGIWVDRGCRADFEVGGGGGGGGNFDGRGSLSWSGTVDDVGEITVRGDFTDARAITGQPIYDVNYRFSGALPRRNVAVRVEKREGRGNVSVVQQPSSYNNYTATIRIKDAKGGSDKYELLISW